MNTNFNEKAQYIIQYGMIRKAKPKEKFEIFGVFEELEFSTYYVFECYNEKTKICIFSTLEELVNNVYELLKKKTKK